MTTLSDEDLFATHIGLLDEAGDLIGNLAPVYPPTFLAVPSGRKAFQIAAFDRKGKWIVKNDLSPAWGEGVGVLTDIYNPVLRELFFAATARKKMTDPRLDPDLISKVMHEIADENGMVNAFELGKALGFDMRRFAQKQAAFAEAVNETLDRFSRERLWAAKELKHIRATLGREAARRWLLDFKFLAGDKWSKEQLALVSLELR